MIWREHSSKYSFFFVEKEDILISMNRIVGCLRRLWIYVSKSRPVPRTNPTSLDALRSCFVGNLYGGNLAFERLKEDFYKAQVNPATLANTEILLNALLKEEHLDLMKLQQTVAKLEMSKSEDSAVKILRAAKEANAKKSHESYEIEMLLAEMLIYKGDFKKALDCKCLEDESIKDARRPLYKAIIHKMWGNTVEVKEFWEEFVEVYDPISPPDFETFERNVDRLKEFAGGSK